MNPFLIGTAILAAVVWLRGGKKTTVSPSGAVVSANPDSYTTPNPASAGVTGPYTTQGVVTPANLPLLPGGVAFASAPAPPDVLSDPTSDNPGSTHRRTRAPQYLSFNFGPRSDLSKSAPSGDTADSGGTGGCGGCSQKKTCSGGSQGRSTCGGGVALVTSRGRQVRNSQPDSWLPVTQENIDSYLAS